MTVALRPATFFLVAFLTASETCIREYAWKRQTERSELADRTLRLVPTSLVEMWRARMVADMSSSYRVFVTQQAEIRPRRHSVSGPLLSGTEMEYQTFWASEWRTIQAHQELLSPRTRSSTHIYCFDSFWLMIIRESTAKKVTTENVNELLIQ